MESARNAAGLLCSTFQEQKKTLTRVCFTIITAVTLTAIMRSSASTASRPPLQNFQNHDTRCLVVPLNALRKAASPQCPLRLLSRHIKSQSEILKSDKANRSEASRFALCLNFFSLFALIRFRFFDKANLKSERFPLSFALLQSGLKATKRN
ncbi:unnamed protein product [Oikopleura dioica]|uniref:Uncharacterized protein n=1 Tax=Oikopleura dioica TaxID=34765 RepID=E4XL68_OIKDI|nr:unnamed protein product [Oikopleura dioica]